MSLTLAPPSARSVVGSAPAVRAASTRSITWKATASSMAIGATVVKTLAFPEWWLLAPLQVCFALLAIEIVFRMARLRAMQPGPREGGITTG